MTNQPRKSGPRKSAPRKAAAPAPRPPADSPQPDPGAGNFDLDPDRVIAKLYAINASLTQEVVKLQVLVEQLVQQRSDLVAQAARVRSPKQAAST